MLLIRQAKLHDLEAVKTFYSQCRYGGGCQKEDLILMAYLETQLAGVVRLCPENKVTVLRGMQVMKPSQGQGIGRQLLQTCVKQLSDQICYCIPWTHLVEFYRLGGFDTALLKEIPDFLQKRFEGYRKRKMEVSIMRRLPIP